VAAIPALYDFSRRTGDRKAIEALAKEKEQLAILTQTPLRSSLLAAHYSAKESRKTRTSSAVDHTRA